MAKNFVSKIFQRDIISIKEEFSRVRTRLENIAWPSEAMAQLGPIAVGECRRAMFYKVVGVTPTDNMTVRGRGICDAGIMYEKYHIEKFKSLGMLIKEQVPLEYKISGNNDVIVAGRLDAIVEFEDALVGVEIKSVSAFKAPAIMGTSGKIPLPASNNLMQAMLYKYWASNSADGQKTGIKDMYLMYVNRSDNSTFYFKVDLDDEGYPVITAIDQSGKELFELKLQEQKSYEQLNTEGGTDEEGRIAELRININDIFSKFDEVYEHANQKVLPPVDYKLIYSDEELEREFRCGRITKRKYNMVKKGTSQAGDYKCSFCAFQKKCLSDSGINFS